MLKKHRGHSFGSANCRERKFGQLCLGICPCRSSQTLLLRLKAPGPSSAKSASKSLCGRPEAEVAVGTLRDLLVFKLLFCDIDKNSCTALHASLYHSILALLRGTVHVYMAQASCLHRRVCQSLRRQLPALKSRGTYGPFLSALQPLSLSAIFVIA